MNFSPPGAAYMGQWIGSVLVQIMACCLFGAKPLSKSMLCYWFSERLIKIQNFSFTKMHLKIPFANWRSFCPGGDELMAWHFVGLTYTHYIHICVSSGAPGYPSSGASGIDRVISQVTASYYCKLYCTALQANHSPSYVLLNMNYFSEISFITHLSQIDQGNRW